MAFPCVSTSLSIFPYMAFYWPTAHAFQLYYHLFFSIYLTLTQSQFMLLHMKQIIENTGGFIASRKSANIIGRMDAFIFAPLTCETGISSSLSAIGENFQELQDVQAGRHVQAHPQLIRTLVLFWTEVWILVFYAISE